ncbi:MAG TPA: ribonuclease P protein component 3 [Methanocella sp.]|uniref:ribonuclease P protein component 3 n=1 Tax=Methanocella sp. TaxID=2052833 RepID=UPI002BA9B7DF|nr:ribonuclease P protein component 3 [Methanocella sp.]HTY90103.1 ribonuclease P protein component 3 [Methanocella sp.]
MADEAYYDLSVHAYPEGGSTASRLAMSAKSLGYAGICVANHPEFFHEVSPSEGAGIIQGVEVVAKNANDLRRQVDRFRSLVKVLAVHGGDPGINRAACEDERVDILLHPPDGKTSGINHILAKLAADKHVAIGFELLPVICSKGGSRVRTLSGYKTNLALAKKYGAPFVVVSGAMSLYDMRDVRAAISLCGLFGMGEKDAAKGLSYYPSEILKRRSPGYIMEGVELVD